MKNLNEKTMSENLSSFLKEIGLLKVFKYNSALYIFPKYKHNRIMGYINPKYCNAPLAQGPDIFDWGKTQEGFMFWSLVHRLWRMMLANENDNIRIEHILHLIRQSVHKGQH